MKLSGAQIKQVRNALLNAYPSRDKLAMMLKISMNENLADVASGEDLTNIVFNLVTWAETTGRLIDLLEGATKENPGNEQIQNLRPLLQLIQEKPQPTASGIYKNAPASQTIGRDEIRKQIDKYVFAAGTLDRTFITLHGPYGVGKTALIAEYFNELDESTSGYDKYWVDVGGVFATSEEVFDLLVVVLAIEVGGLNPLDGLITELARRPVFLVLDEVDLQELPGLRGFLNRLQPGSRSRVVVTGLSETRLPRELAMEVPLLSAVDARTLLLQRIGRSEAECSVAEMNAIDRVVRRLDALPALIEQIAQHADMAPLEDLPEVLEQIGAYAADENEANTVFSVVSSTLDKLNEQEFEFIRRVALFGNIIHNDDVAFIAEQRPSIIGAFELRRKIANRRLWSFDHKAKVIRIPSYVLKPVRNRPGSTQAIRRAAGNRLLQGDYRGRFGWIAGLELLYESQAWQQVLVYAEKRFGVSENASVFPETDDKLLEARASWAIAFVHYRLGDSRQAIHFAEKGIEALTAGNWLKTRLLLIRLQTIMAYEYFQEGRIDDALEYLRAVEELVQDLSEQQAENMQLEIARIWLLRGLYETQRVDGDLNLARELTTLAVGVFGQSRDHVYLMKALSNLGTIYYALGMREESLQVSQQILEDTDSAGIVDTSLVATEYSNVVDFYIGSRDWQNALRYAAEGALYCEKYGEIGQYVMLELNAAAADYGIRDAEELSVRLRRAEEYRDIVGEQILYKAMFEASYAKHAFLQADMVSDEVIQDQWLLQARQHIDQIITLPGAETNAQVKEVVNELEEINRAFR